MLSQLATPLNPDMASEIYGTLNDDKGIKIRLSNVEHVSDTLFSHWKGVLWKHGYNASISHMTDMQQVTIVAYRRYSWSTMVVVFGMIYLIAKLIIQII